MGLAAQLLASEQRFLDRMAALLKAVEDCGALTQDEAQGVAGPLSRVVEVSKALVAKLSAGDPVWGVVDWMQEVLGVAFARYVESYHTFIEPLLGHHHKEKLEAWAGRTGRAGGAWQVAADFGAPVSRPSQWGFIVRKARCEAGGVAADEAAWDRFVSGVDEFVRKMFAKYAAQASVAQTPVTSSFAKTQPRLAGASYLHTGEMTKEFARGRHVRVFYLYSNALVHFKLTPDGLKHKGMKASRNVLLLENILDIDVLDSGGSRTTFRICRKDAKKDMVLHCDTAEERDYWIDAIRHAMGGCAGDDGAEHAWQHEPAADSLAARGGIFQQQGAGGEAEGAPLEGDPSPGTSTPDSEAGSLHTTPRHAAPAVEPVEPAAL
eukprot:TRINITY_DN29652_c0_g1_i1.p1 TRINITY_DN29652_c0_g1~~TRINITY_DN29652_c0_g1_i1.p1  ORF type:complete len:378 (+),score=137.10 TRINITY_DN29652_c0_g1_i1:50-1183(+)